MHLNPRSGRWLPDPSARAHHIGIAVAYTAWQYYQVTRDISFLIDYSSDRRPSIDKRPNAATRPAKGQKYMPIITPRHTSAMCNTAPTSITEFEVGADVHLSASRRCL
ncbi:MAG: hypothetical protein JOZ49_07925 [Mycolicibacterium sp.]|nr:hypothetical protein [Mycolicibacterium sp.]